MQISATENAVSHAPHALMDGWRFWRVEIGVPRKFGGDGHEFGLWAPPHVDGDALEAFLQPKSPSTQEQDDGDI